MITFESRDIRGTENMHLSRVIYYGNSNMTWEMRMDRVRVILCEKLEREDFRLVRSYDGKNDMLIVPCGISALKELRDKVFTITERF